MLKRIGLVLSLVLPLVMPPQATAEITYPEMVHSFDKSQPGKQQVLENYLIGLYEGINAANIAYYMQTRQRMFCMPDSLDLKASDLRKLITESHETFDSQNEIPVSYLLFIGLKQTFPCL